MFFEPYTTDEPPVQTVFVKRDLMEVGVGSIPATRLWESEVNDDTGEFAHIARDAQGQLYLSITDMEEHHGSYVSIKVRDEDFAVLIGEKGVEN